MKFGRECTVNKCFLRAATENLHKFRVCVIKIYLKKEMRHLAPMHYGGLGGCKRQSGGLN